MDGECKSLVDKCKAEAKGLVEVTATRRKIHWAHPAFTSFCVSVEDILSYQVKRRYRSNKTTTPSGHILRELGKSFPTALEVYNKAFSGSKEGKQDYSTAQTSSDTERKVLWIRVALIEGSLANIVEQLVTHPRLFYDDKAVLCHPVYSQVFQSLIDGPCSIRYSRLKFSDGGYNTLSPSELVHRHKKVLSIAASNGDSAGASERAWGHVQSLYQSNNATCLFGKNNILVKPPSAPSPLRGYLTLQQSAFGELQLKWIPNCLLNSSVATSGLWDQVIAVDITQEIAHIHCHRAQGCTAEMLLIGYDGIAHPPLLFPHQPSLFLFLESLENSLLPKGCLEPPLWYLRQSSKNKASTDHTHSPCDDEDMEAWNQVFRIRYGGPKDTPPTVLRGTPPNPLPLTLPPYSSTAEESTSSSESEGEEPVAMETTSVANWESFQSEVSKQLLARHFYSWLSHCRHMTKVRQSVAHLVSSNMIQPHDVTDDVTGGSPLSEREWAEFSQLSSSEREERWGRVLRRVYLCGVEHSIRAQVWPTLLGVYPATSSLDQRKDILATITASYRELMAGWRRSEVTHRQLTRAADNSHESSPSLSSISPSPPQLSPCHHGNNDTVPMATQVIAELEALGVDSDGLSSEGIPAMSCDYIQPMAELDEKGEKFLQDLYNIDKDIPRCDRDYWYFKSAGNLLKIRNIVCTYVWDHLSEGYSQGMCDLLAPILVATDNEPLAYACYLKLMEHSSQLFPPSSVMNTRLGNLKALLQVMEPDYHGYLTQRPMGDGFFYCYRWLLVCFKREFCYEDLFRIWECTWVARLTVSQYFEEFLALAIMKQFQSAIMDAHLDPSDILNLFTELADKHKIDCDETLRTAIAIIHKLQEDLAVK